MYAAVVACPQMLLIILLLLSLVFITVAAVLSLIIATAVDVNGNSGADCSSEVNSL